MGKAPAKPRARALVVGVDDLLLVPDPALDELGCRQLGAIRGKLDPADHRLIGSSGEFRGRVELLELPWSKVLARVVKAAQRRGFRAKPQPLGIERPLLTDLVQLPVEGNSAL
jgi:hypothetical protein